MRDHRVVSIRFHEGREVFGDNRRFVAAPVPRDGDIVIPRGVESLQLSRDQTQGRCDDDLVDHGGVRAREDGIAEAAVASTRGVGLAGGARQQEQDPRGGRLPIALLDATAESDVWNRPRALSRIIRLESTTSMPAYTRMDRFEGLASPVTAAIFAGPRDSRKRSIAATNSRGDRWNSGPFARNTASVSLALGRSSSPATIPNSPAAPSSGISRSAMERGIPLDGGRSSGWFPMRGSK